MEKVTYYGETDGISLEQMVRSGTFNMRVKHFHPSMRFFISSRGNGSSFLITESTRQEPGI